MSRPNGSTNGKHPLHERLDRHPYYLGVHAALLFAAFGIIAAPIGTGAIADLTTATQQLLAVTMAVGSTLVLIGAGLGLPAFKPMRWVRRTIFHVPPMPLHHAYMIGAGGLMATTTALSFFGWVIISQGSLIGTATGAITPVLAIVSARMASRLMCESFSMARDYDEVRKAVDGSSEESS